MKLSIVAAIVIGLVAICGPYVAEGHPGGVTTTTIQHVQAEDSDSHGFWQKKVTWKPRWVKHWQQKAIYVPVWKKVWGPVVHNEWVPIPSPPPDWQPAVHDVPHK